MIYFKDLMQTVFTNIYTNGIWSGGKHETLSGLGSTLEYSKTTRSFINNIINEYQIKTIIDLGCGEMNWQKHLDLTNVISYTGIDVVDQVIKSNIDKFKQDSKFKFYTSDITELKDSLNVDLLICREVLFHLCLSDVAKVLDIIKSSSAKYVILTSHENTQNNNIQNGKFFELNVLAEPFRWPEPKPTSKAKEDFRPNRYLYMYEISKLNNI